MLFEIAMLLLGFFLLFKGAVFLVDNSCVLAKRYGISPLVIGLTIVAFGTSLPEFFVNIISAVTGNSSIGVGNVVGSNIANIGLILGLCATFQCLRLKQSTVVREIPFMIFVSLLFIALSFKSGLMNDGSVIGFFGAFLLLAFFFIYLFFVVKSAQLEDKNVYNKFGKAFPLVKKSSKHLLALIVVGLFFLTIGADLLVKSTIAIARDFGVPEFFIAVTIIAFGTTLPELSISLAAVFKKEADLAVGNLIGSNIFNIALIIGVSALISPIAIDSSMWLSFAFMFFLSLILLPLTINQHKIKRREGLFLLALYGLYLLLLFST